MTSLPSRALLSVHVMCLLAGMAAMPSTVSAGAITERVDAPVKAEASSSARPLVPARDAGSTSPRKHVARSAFEVNEGHMRAGVRLHGRAGGYGFTLTDDATELTVAEHDEHRVARARAKVEAREAARADHRQRTHEESSDRREKRLRALTQKLAREEPRQTDKVTLQLIGANRTALTHGEEPTGTVAHYLSLVPGQPDRTHVRQYRRVRTTDVLPGIDKVVYETGGRIEYDFVVRPGADPRAIVHRIRGATAVRLLPGGDLQIVTPRSTILLSAPVAYQTSGSARTPVQVQYRLRADELTFDVGGYDPARDLVIDPVVEYVTAFTGEVIDAVAAGDGEVAMVLPRDEMGTPLAAVEPAPFTSSSNVIRLARDGASAVSATYLIGLSATSIAADAAGRLIIAGSLYDGRLFVGRLARDGASFEFKTTVDDIVARSASVAVRASGELALVASFNLGSNGQRGAPAVDHVYGDPAAPAGLFVMTLDPPSGARKSSVRLGSIAFRNTATLHAAIDSSGAIYAASTVVQQDWTLEQLAENLINPLPIADRQPTDEWLETWWNPGPGLIAKFPADLSGVNYFRRLYGSSTHGTGDILAGRQPQSSTGIAIDASDNVFVFSEFISKYSPDGDLLASAWAALLHDANVGLTHSLAADGTILVTGNFDPYPLGFRTRSEFMAWLFSQPNPGPRIPRSHLRRINADLLSEQPQIFLTGIDLGSVASGPNGDIFLIGSANAHPLSVSEPGFGAVSTNQPINRFSTSLAIRLGAGPKLASFPRPSALGQAVLLSFFTPAPDWAGSVTFSNGTQTLGTAAVDAGKASLATSTYPSATTRSLRSTAETPAGRLSHSRSIIASSCATIRRRPP